MPSASAERWAPHKSGTTPPTDTEILVYGHVRSVTDRQPVPLIEVSVHRDGIVVDHTHTDSEGRYDLAVPAEDWSPSGSTPVPR